MTALVHPTIKDGWYFEKSSQWPGQAMGFKVNKILHVEKSQYQDVLVFESETYGNVLVLDGITQVTERDEFSYSEMIAHIPMASHPNPKRVLIIGGGDGGAVREVLKHPSVEHVVLCDIDEAVIRVSRKYLHHLSSAFDDPKLTIHIGDGFKFMADNKESYDVIITDSSDPDGPADALFRAPYYQLVHSALAPGGVCSAIGESVWSHLDLIESIKAGIKNVFPVVDYVYGTLPAYPTGQVGFIVCGKEKGTDFRKPLRKVSGCKYYNEDMHRAAFILPEFAKARLERGEDILPKLPEPAKTKGGDHAR